MSFVGNLLGFPAVKEFGISVKNNDKVITMSSVYYFFEIQCIYNYDQTRIYLSES